MNGFGKARRMAKRPAILLVPLSLCCTMTVALSGGEPAFTITFKDGVISPLRIEVPANTRFQLELRNAGETPAEFESAELRKEKVLAPKSSSVLVFRTLDPGEYSFCDDFHPDAPKAELVAK